MSIVVNLAAVKPRLETLGWTEIVNVTEAATEIEQAGIPVAAVLAYLDALIAAPTSLDDTTIANCDEATAAKITAYLKKKGVVAA